MAKRKKKLAKEEAERILAKGGRELNDALRALPDDVDPVLAGSKVLELLEGNAWYAGRRCRELPVPVVDEVLAKIDPRNASPWLTFVHAHVGAAADRAGAWSDALIAMLDLNTSYGFGSRQQIAKLTKVANDPRGIEAARAVAATRAEGIPWRIQAVLLIDGADASIDALLPVFDRALDKRDGSLDLLLRLARHASPRMRALLANARGAKAEREKASPATALARRLFGDDAPAKLWFEIWLDSVEENGSRSPERIRQPRASLKIRIDTQAPAPFVAYFHDNVSPRPHPRDSSKAPPGSIDAGPETIDDLPRWLDRVARDLGVTWGWGRAQPRSSLRGKRREQMTAWLRGV